MHSLDLPQARQHHVLQTLQVWKQALTDTRSAMLPPQTSRPNPLVIGDSVVASVFSPGAVVSLEKESGQPQWSHKLDAYGGSCVMHADGRIYAKSSRTVYCFDSASGHEYWKFSPDMQGSETVYSFPTFHRDMVFFGDRAGVFRCLDARSGEQIWAEKVSSGRNNQVNSTAVICNDLVVVGTNDSLVAAFDTTTGQGAWKQSIDGPCITEILARDGKLLATTTTSIYALDTSTGAILLRKNWHGMDVHAVILCPDSLVAVLKPQWVKTEQPSTGASGDKPRLIALRDTAELFNVEAAEFIVGMRFHRDTGLIYESRFDGLGVIDPSSGERLHNVHSEQEPLGYGLVDIDRGRIYAMDMGKNIYCLRSPES